jgi:outer membrane biosynthesis protein TonB
MKPVGLISTGALLLLLGTIAPGYAQREQQEKEQGKPQQAQQQHQQPQKEQGKPQQAQQHQQEKPAQQQHQQQANKPAQRPQQTYGAAYHGGVHPSGVPQHQGQVRSGFVQSRATSWNKEHRNWQQRGGYNGYRVPDNRYRQYFGNDH